MEPEHIYAYACLRTGHNKDDLIENIQNTKLYNDYMYILHFMEHAFVDIPRSEIILDATTITNNMLFNPMHRLQIDIMTSTRNGMYYKLDSIIEQARKSPVPNTALIVASINSFGTLDNIKKYYKIFRKEKIGVLIPDYTRESSLSEYSTIGFGLDLVEHKPEYDRAFDLVENLEPGDIQDNRGRIAGEYTRTFRVAFWLYELFRIPEKMAVAMSGFSKNGFHLKADSYEQTLNYRRELEKFDKLFGISSLIKRNRPVPSNFDKLIHWEEKKNSLERACIHCKVPMIFPIDYKRLKLKQEGGKKELARCLKLYDTNLINYFDEWVKQGNAPIDFYSKCNFEQYLENTWDIK